MRASFSIINKIIWKTPFNVIFGLLVPIIIAVISINVFSVGIDTTSTTSLDAHVTLISITSLLPTYSLNAVTAITICILPCFIFTFKQSDIMQRFSFNSKNIVVSYIAMAIYFFVFSFCIYIISFIFLSLFALASGAITDRVNHIHQEFNNIWQSLKYTLTHANYWEIFYSLFIYIALAISIGFLIGLYLNKYMTIIIVSMCILLVSYICGGIIPLQMLALSSHGNGGGGANIWAITYIYPLRAAMLPLIEAWTQGPIQNKGTLDWNAYMFLGISEQIPWSMVHKFGYTSIFNIHYPFVTNGLQVPRASIAYGNFTFNTWYPDSNPANKSWNTNILLWGILWMNLDIPKQFLDYGVKSLDVFTFANGIEKLLDLLLPYLFMFIIWMLFAADKLWYQKRRNYENMK